MINFKRLVSLLRLTNSSSVMNILDAVSSEINTYSDKKKVNLQLTSNSSFLFIETYNNLISYFSDKSNNNYNKPFEELITKFVNLIKSVVLAEIRGQVDFTGDLKFIKQFLKLKYIQINTEDDLEKAILAFGDIIIENQLNVVAGKEYFILNCEHKITFYKNCEKAKNGGYTL
jgi:hypothetical protein